jgi:MoaA/NifB/PqqE/SkfB family radical SAM enzyme
MGRLSFRERLRNYRERIFGPETDWIQVEVSSYCNASCLYCPRTVYRDVWTNRHLSLTVFKKLLPAMANTKLVFLQGWGEPFLNPDIFAMIALVKKVGCRVGTTTNGMLLDDRRMNRLLETGIDIISFSVAGLDESNDTLRDGTRLQTVLDGIEKLSRAKETRRSANPAIHLSYLLLRSGLGDLARIPDVLPGLGIDQVVISTLDFVPTKELEEETLCPDNMGEYEEWRFILDDVKARAESKGLYVHYNLGRADRPGKVCSENPQRSFYVSSYGTISPCVFTNLPVSNASRSFRGERLPYESLTFGNIGNHSISAIWRQKEYGAFRRSFVTGRPMPVCSSCYKLYVA